VLAIGQIFPWGVAPGLHKPAPLALNTYLRSSCPSDAFRWASEKCGLVPPLRDARSACEILRGESNSPAS
jgi:hypothetical protein